MTSAQRYVTVALALAFGVLCALPAWRFRLEAGASFQGVELQATDAELHYTSRVQEVRDGAFMAANVYYSEPKDQPYFFPPLPEMVIAGLGYVTGLDTPRAVTLSRFVFGAMLWVVMVGLLTLLTKRWAISLLAVAVLLLAGPLFPWPQLFLQLIHGTAGALEFLPFSRPVNPQWSVTLFTGALWAFLTWTRTRSVRALAVAAALTIASFYSYIYVWTLLGVVYAAFFIRALLQRHAQDIRQLLFFGISILIGAAPYAWNVWQATQHPLYAASALRHGFVTTHQPVFSITLAALVVVVLLLRKRLGVDFFFVGSIVASMIVALNQQVLTGHALAPPHYHWYFIKPFLILFLTLLVVFWIQDVWKRYQLRAWPLTVAWSVTLVALFGFGVAYQQIALAASRPFWMDLQRAGPVLQYLREHVHPGDVVYARDAVRNLVPAYTSADVYWATDAYLYLSSDARARDAYFFDLWIDGVSANEVRTSFYGDRREELSSRLHAIYYREALGSYARIPDAEIEQEVQAYQVYLSQTEEERLSAYPLTIVILDKRLPDTTGIRTIEKRGTLSYEDDAYQVYKLTASPK